MGWIPKVLGTVITICLIHDHSCRKIPAHEASPESPEYSEEPVVTSRSKHRKPTSSESDNLHQNTKPEKWRLEFDIPALLRTLKQYTGMSIGSATIIDDSDPHGQKPVTRNRNSGLLNQKYTFEMEPPDVDSILEGFKTMLHLARRYNRVYYGYTEEGPGVIKSENVTYPARYQEGKLFNLLRLKKKRNGRK